MFMGFNTQGSGFQALRKLLWFWRSSHGLGSNKFGGLGSDGEESLGGLGVR